MAASTEARTARSTPPLPVTSHSPPDAAAGRDSDPVRVAVPLGAGTSITAGARLGNHSDPESSRFLDGSEHGGEDGTLYAVTPRDLTLSPDTTAGGDSDAVRVAVPLRAGDLHYRGRPTRQPLRYPSRRASSMAASTEARTARSTPSLPVIPLSSPDTTAGRDPDVARVAVPPRAVS